MKIDVEVDDKVVDQLLRNSVIMELNRSIQSIVRTEIAKISNKIAEQARTMLLDSDTFLKAAIKDEVVEEVKRVIEQNYSDNVIDSRD